MQSILPRGFRVSALLFLIGVSASAQPVCSCAGGLSTYPAGTEPACEASNRGTVIMTLGERGQSDLLKACVRDALGRYSWLPTGQQSTTTYVNSRFVGGCPIFPDNNIWNSKADSLPVHANSAAIIQTYSGSRVGADPAMYINQADASTPRVPVKFEYADESDTGLYPITGDMQVEGYAFTAGLPVSRGPYPGDAHLLVIRTNECKLYEAYALSSSAAPFTAASGAIFDLTKNDLRPAGWTSADAAGLPIWPGVLTYDEVYGSEEIRHVLRFTVNRTRNEYVWPARHAASRNSDAALPPMGSRWRLKANFDDTTCRADEHSGQAFPPEARKLIRALKQYGMMLADNGASIRLTTDADPRWGELTSETSPNWIFNGWTHCLRGSDFEVVDAAPLMISPNSAATAQ